jgi:ABC-type uncharacterized transport system permease subunit
MRRLATALASAFAAAVVAGLAWALMFMQFTEVPGEVLYPADWRSLSLDAQNEWLIAHSVTISGFQALRHVVENVPAFAPQLLGFFGLLFATAVGALALNWFLQHRAP